MTNMIVNVTTHPRTKKSNEIWFLIFYPLYYLFIRWLPNKLIILFLHKGFKWCFKFFPLRLVHNQSRYSLTMGFVWFVNVTLITDYLSFALKPKCVDTLSPPNKNNIELVLFFFWRLLIHTTAIVFVNTDANKTTCVHEFSSIFV